MFRYKKQIAYVALIMFILLTIVIWLFALQPADGSGKTSSRIYAFLFGLNYDNRQTETDLEEKKITSITLTSPAYSLNVGDKVSLNVKCLPENYTEGINFSSDNEKVATVDDKGTISCKAKGTVNITAKSKSGAVSSKITITVYDQTNVLDGFDREKFTYDIPNSLAQNDCVQTYIYYDNKISSLDYTLSSDKPSVLETKGKFIISRLEGTAKLTVKVGREILFEKDITVTDEVKQEPIISSMFIGETLIESQPITVFLGKNYDLNLHLDNADTAVQSYIISKSNNITTIIYSNSSRDLQINTKQCGTTKITLYSRTNLNEPLRSFTLNIIPPKLVSHGLQHVNEYHIDTEYGFWLTASDKNALVGYTYKVYKGDKLIEPKENGRYVFKEIGEYQIVYTSEYYPDDVYKFTIIVESASVKAILRKEIGHFGLFAVLGVFAMIAFGRLIAKYIPKGLICGLSGLFVAIVSEILQLPLFTQGRGASFNDVLIDYAGFLFGLAFTFCVIHSIHFIRSKRSTSSDKDK